jgi:hypothetical protein
MLDADTCLAPTEGLFAPAEFSPYATLVQNLLLPDTGDETVLQVVVQPSFESPYSLRLQQPRPNDNGPDRPRPYRLRLVRAKEHPWPQMMDEMRRQQGNPFKIGAAEQQRGLPAVSRATETKTVPFSSNIADRLAAVWAGALARTQYPKEVTKAPDGCRIIVDKVDGTTYDFWHAGRSGTTHSPEKGTLLDDLVTVVETLTRYADAPAASQPALVRQLDAELGSLQLRIERGEPCLRPRPHRHDAKKR